MKNPHQLSTTWKQDPNKDPVLVSMSCTNKKFKRKSREPKRLFSSPEPERRRPYQGDMSDEESVDDTQTEACHVGTLAPLQRQLMIPQEAAAITTEILSGLPGGNLVSAQSGAIDMRIGINLPEINSKLSQLPSPPFPNPEISHWPTVISQPLSNRLKLGLCSTFPLSMSTGCSHSRSPGHQASPPEPSPAGQASAQPGPRIFQTSMCQEHVEQQAESPKEFARKRTEMGADGPACLPEVKAIQQTRRLLANARERTRVHTISAAFEALRKQVPCYSYGQKLSKLAILRIACNYILSLAQLAEQDYSSDRSSLNFSQCVEQCTRTLQAEGRSKKRKVGRMPEDL